MAKYLFKPIGNYVSSSSYVFNPSSAYDTDTYGDTSTYSYNSSTSTAGVILPFGCNNSVVLNLINSGGKIKSLVCHVKARKYSSSTPSSKAILARCVYDITSGNTGWIQAGSNESVQIASSLTTSITEYTVSFPGVVDFFNANPQKFVGMGCRFFGTYWRLYDLWWEIEFDSYVTYDSIFSYQKWKNSGIVSGHSATISNITDTGFTITAGVNDSYTGDSPFVPVTPGNKYTIEYDYSGSGNEVFVFYHTSDSVGWDDLKSSSEKKFDFTVPSGHPYITIRCDSNIQGNAVSYSNFRIYPASETYMSNSVLALERSDVNSWSMPTPQREGYNFLGWYTGINGSGTKYTASSGFPTGDLVLYSAWEANQYYLDLNGFIDGASTGGISPAGTADVYINGALVSDDCTDYWTQHYYGSTYEIKDIRANAGYAYIGVKSGSLSGTITGNTAVVLEFKRLPPEITDVKITYGSQPVSKLNKVPCGEGFILSVGVGYLNSILG